jgi:hypothetical protein
VPGLDMQTANELAVRFNKKERTAMLTRFAKAVE